VDLNEKITGFEAFKQWLGKDQVLPPVSFMWKLCIFVSCNQRMWELAVSW